MKSKNPYFKTISELRKILKHLKKFEEKSKKANLIVGGSKPYTK
jgi:hypothetical protein